MNLSAAHRMLKRCEREARTAGDDANQIGGFALSIGNKLYRAAAAENPKRVAAMGEGLRQVAALPDPVVPALERDYSILVTGIGGTGVLTVGALMGMAGAPFPYYIGYLEPGSAFGLSYAVNSIAMPMIGGTTSWIGPLVGAVLLGSAQQYITVTISSAANLLVVGLMLVIFVIIAPGADQPDPASDAAQAEGRTGCAWDQRLTQRRLDVPAA